MDSSQTKDLLQKSQTLVDSLQQKVNQLEQQLQTLTLENSASNANVPVVATSREKTRLTKSTGKNIADSEGRIGGDFVMQENPEFLNKRLELFERLYKQQQEDFSKREKKDIKITLPDGTVKEGKAFETSPLDIANGISSIFAKQMIIAKVQYTNRLVPKLSLTSGQEELESGTTEESELWDLSRPLEGDCKLRLLDFGESEGKMVFWHSSAHLLGECLECKLGSYLSVGPPVESGFYYDSYLGKPEDGQGTISEAMLKELEKLIEKKAKEKQVFQRLVLSKEDALEMFAYNPYKLSIIKNKVPEGGLTQVYRNGPFVDLCMGPHIVDSSQVKAVELKQATTSYWLANASNDALQRVHGISFPDKARLKEWKVLVKKAEENDHRKKGIEQDLFFFHHLSPGSAFWTQYGGRLFTKLVGWMQENNRKNGYTEVVTPNVYSVELWKTSGHWEHYKDNMFLFSDGEQENNLFGLKPMNCPGHCLIFDSRVRSYRDLPLRLSDFGVLHRNEASGALSGLTRVRRFQQDDAHIYCRPDQVKTEILACLGLVRTVYDTLGLKTLFGRSTRPKKAAGLETPEGVQLWDKAEDALKEALDSFVGKGNWTDNPGDGAFYGPKIDIQVFDALKRKHQCATIQLDFQMPLRFGLKYKTHDEGYERPVMIHRAVLGSIERVTGILTEHFEGKWPFWLSPRQIILIPVSNSEELNNHCEKLRDKLYAEGFDVDLDLSSKTLNKKILLAQRAQFNIMLVIGQNELKNNTVNIRTRRNAHLGEKSFQEAVELFKHWRQEKLLDTVVDPIVEKSGQEQKEELKEDN